MSHCQMLKKLAAARESTRVCAEMTLRIVALVLALSWSVSVQAADIYSGLLDKKENFGGVLAPPSLPGGSSSLYAYVGAPDIAAGYRLGLGGLELDARARLNWVMLSLGADVLLKGVLLRGSGFELAPFVGPGIAFNTGARYLNSGNFRSVGLRIIGGVTASYRLAETWRLLALVEVPVELSLTPGGSGRFAALGGGGVEVYLGEDFSGLVLGQLGLQTLKDQLATSATQWGYSLRFGLGYRLD